MLGDAVQRVAVVHPEDLPAPADRVSDALGPAYDVLRLPVPAGERAKSAEVAAGCWESLGAAGFTRSDAVVTVGGGATTDLGGFVAATWLRGVRVVHVPTTLLGMVDAAVGGKTGINTTAGKNLVGAFHEPAGVLCDLDLLATLPERRAAFGPRRGGQVRLHRRPRDPARSSRAPHRARCRRARRCSRSWSSGRCGSRRPWSPATCASRRGDGDPGREVLNYGHTMGHAVEQASDYGLRHGEAVAIGMRLRRGAGRAAAGLLDDPVVERHRTAFAGVGLPTGWSGASYDDLRARMAVDKKSRGSTLRFVVLDGLASPRILADPDDAHLRAAYDAMVGGAA